MTAHQSTPLDRPPVTLDAHQRLSQSLLWQLQRQFFEQQGIQAWNTGKVPHYATSNPFIANAYGQMVLGFLRDWSATGPAGGASPLDPRQPLYILELGAGSGRFAYHFLKQFFAQPPHPLLQTLSVKYVMTDFAPHNLDFWQTHPALRPYIEQGRLDFARFDIQSPAPIQLVHSGESLSAETLTHPLIVLANYFFDSIPQDLFAIQAGQLQETQLTLTLPTGDADLPPAELLERLQITYADQPIAADYYDDPAFNQVLQHYSQQLDDTSLMLPIAALEGLAHLRQLTGDRLLFLTADKGYSREVDLAHRAKPKLVFHQGCFSLSVNYHALALYTQYQGGLALVPHHRPRSLTVCAFLFGTPATDYAETRQAYQQWIQQTGPDNFFALKKTIEPLYPTLNLPQILAYLRFSGWDHNIFWGCWPTLMALVETAPDTLRQGVVEAIQKVWDMYYWIGEDKNLPLQLARLLAQLGDDAAGLDYLEHSLQLYGEAPDTRLHQAICLLRQGQTAAALGALERALDLQPQWEAAQALKQAIETGSADLDALVDEAVSAQAEDLDSRAAPTSVDPLTLSLWGLRLLLERHIEDEPPIPLDAVLEAEPSSLAQLGDTFNLSDFERTLLLLCLGQEIEPHFRTLCAQIHGDDNKPYATLGLALTAFPDADWAVLSPQSPLHHWRLIQPEPGRLLTDAPLKLDRRILCYLLDEPAFSPQLSDLITPLSPEGVTDASPPAYQAIVQQLIDTWSAAASPQGFPLICLIGPDADAQTNVAVAACDRLGLQLMALPAAVLPTDPQALGQFQRLWEREALLTYSALLLDCETANPADPGRDAAISLFLETLNAPAIVSSRHRKPQVRRPLITVDVPPLSYTEQKHLWQTHLGPLAKDLNGYIDLLAAQFQLSPAAVQSVCMQVRGISHKSQVTSHKSELAADLDDKIQNSKFKIQNSNPDSPAPLSTHLWDLCRAQARPNLEDLAQRIEATATWEDLVLPDRQRLILEDMAAHLNYRARVYQAWGFAKKGDRGLGISALFYGESGTGKTMAAEVLAQACNLDLYRIDLSTVVNKYIGETEKNLRRIFDAAEAGGAILLFDEADALFGKRSEVKDSHDRHANIEVSYLLQRMEAYRGLAILTSNLKDSLDKAFLRRLRFMAPFPFPDAEARAEIWRRIFPAQTPTQGLDYDRLGQLKVTGGHIRNIALNAAFLAAQGDRPVTMKHIRQSAQREYLKLEKLLTPEEIKDW